MTAPATRLLTRSDVAALLSMPDCIDAVETAFLLHGRGKVAPPQVMGMRVEGGSFHIRTAALPGAPPFFAAKTNAKGGTRRSS